jgi:hypothetical protein
MLKGKGLDIVVTLGSLPAIPVNVATAVLGVPVGRRRYNTARSPNRGPIFSARQIFARNGGKSFPADSVF